MGLRGPRPELPTVQALKGNPGKRKVEKAGIVAEGAAFVAAHLSEDAQACIEIIKASMPPQTYAKADSFALASFATAWAEHKGAVEALASEPRIVPGARGAPMVNPWVRILNDQARIMAALGDRLGLDPKARAGLKLNSEDKPKSKFDGLIGGAKLN